MLRSHDFPSAVNAGVVRRTYSFRIACIAASLIACTLGIPAIVRAQQPRPQSDSASRAVMPESGSRVRLIIPPVGAVHRRHVTGRLVELRRDSVRVVSDQGETVAAAFDHVESFDISTGRRLLFLESIGVGALAGVGFGAFVGAVSQMDCQGFCFSTSENAMFGGILGGLGGLVIGALVGVTTSTDRWERIPATRVSRRLSVTPQLGDTRGVSVRLRS